MLHIVFFQHGFNMFFIDAVEPDTGIIDFFFILQSLADIERAVIQQKVIQAFLRNIKENAFPIVYSSDNLLCHGFHSLFQKQIIFGTDFK